MSKYKHFLNEAWCFICSKGLEEDFYNTLSKTDKDEIKQIMLEVEE